MTNSGRRFFSGNTLEQAVMQAASHYQIDPDEVAYRKIEKRHGFLKTRRGVVIDVDPDNPRRVVGLEILEAGPVETEAPESPEMAEPREDETIFEVGDAGDEPIELAELGTPAEPDPEPEDDAVAPPEPLPEATGEMAEAALEAVGAVLEVAGLDLKADIFQGDGQLEIELSGPGQQELVADRGSLLLAIQHLL
ncbi:MAG: hypothetical protein WBO54_14860, partial [Thermoanaerobaculia bacterium]